ncbi:MAG: RNA-binding protein [Calditrichaeota bacterium]|nr:RNA-binding protein [Candidatus Cloacimonadota bacterium]MCA9785704.1 RNA-binding protein [Candidatus Cloacimonadota bacterium]MCB1047178.1 RNA-binding protein [Calditrichota bacterium]MCB9474039.1 RNA-binding protein [Candidatus Delongbacteria bacterium]
MKLYVGNMAFSVTDAQLRTAFEAFGTVEEVAVINDRDTGRPKGFAFVTMPNAQEANAAINGLNEKDLGGRNLRVNEAKPKTEGGGSRW